MDLLFENGSRLAFGALRALLLSKISASILPYQYATDTPPGDVYDFVVVGSGVGGSTVASRLSETGASVLVLEAGGDAPPETAIPGIDLVSLVASDRWQYKAKYLNKSMLAYGNRETPIVTGKGVGGTTNIYGCHYLRGNRRDLDAWRDMGNTGWDYDSVLPYYLKTEKYRGEINRKNARYHNRHGPLSVTPITVRSPVIPAFLGAGKELGYPTIDPSMPTQIGFTRSYLTVDKGVRRTASEAFLRPVIDRPNLTVVPGAHVRRVLFNGKNRAVGVEYKYKGNMHSVKCRKEVILAAGALNTPQILMLSGIGPPRHLAQLGISVKSAVEGVGKNLQNHPLTTLYWKVRNHTTTPALRGVMLGDVKQYFRSQTGPLSTFFGGEGYGYMSLGRDAPRDWPDAIVSVTSTSMKSAPPIVLESLLGLRREVIEDIMDPIGANDDLAIQMFLARPKTRGSVTLQSNNFLDQPIVEDDPCQHPDDIDVVIKGIRKCFEVANTKAMKTMMNTEFVSKQLRLCKQHVMGSDDYWRCYIKYNTVAGLHYTSTAKMAPRDDPLGVVSPQLKVRGVLGLRVVDGSVIPTITASNPAATIYMIAEKASDIIKKNWRYL